VYGAVDRARDERDVDALIEILARGERRARVAAAQYLGELGARRGIDGLTRTLHASDLFLRCSSVNALAAMGDPRVVDQIADVGLTDRTYVVRSTAFSALRRFDDPRATDVLLGILEADDLVGLPGLSDRRHRVKARQWAAGMLAELGVVEALPALERARSEASGLERWRLRQAIRKLKSRARVT
jgi:hypothetical protein